MAAGIAELRLIADYQFGTGSGQALFPDSVEIHRTSSGRPQQIFLSNNRLVSYGIDGRFTLGMEGGYRLQAHLSHPKYRVIVDDESEPFVRTGRNVFAKFVTSVDHVIRPGDEILVEHTSGRLIAVGRAELSAEAMDDFDTGMAVKVRDSIE